MDHTTQPKKMPRVNNLLLASLFLLAQTIATASAAHWNAPLRIGIQAQGLTKSFLSNSKSSKSAPPLQLLASSKVNGNNDKNDERLVATDTYSDDDEKWRALFRQQGQANNPSAYPASTASRRRLSSTQNNNNNVEGVDTRGFRNSLPLPAFFKTRPMMDDCEEISYANYEDATTSINEVLPCAAKRTVHSKNSNVKSSTATAEAGAMGRPLKLWENMVCGAISRSVAQTMMHPANSMKTLLQQKNAPPIATFLTLEKFPLLYRGAGANFILSVPHGAINFAVLEKVRKELARGVQSSPYWREREEKIAPALDFLSSAISTICCSVVSTPQMMITDNIMAGNYNNLPSAVRGLASQGKGIGGFYARGWWPGLVGKIPSYALTWTFFQQLKVAQKKISGREATNLENSIMGCIGSATTVCIMIPMDTIKTRLVTQASSAAVKSGAIPYKGIIDCAVRVTKEEGIKTFYRGLPPRLVSVVPMIGIQFAVYEFMKRTMQRRSVSASIRRPKERGLPLEQYPDPYSSLGVLQETAMEVAASPEHPYPAPHFLKFMKKKKTTRKQRQKK